MRTGNAAKVYVVLTMFVVVLMCHGAEAQAQTPLGVRIDEAVQEVPTDRISITLDIVGDATDRCVLTLYFSTDDGATWTRCTGLEVRGEQPDGPTVDVSNWVVRNLAPGESIPVVWNSIGNLGSQEAREGDIVLRAYVNYDQDGT